jgi:hypothetical protein
MYTPVTHLMPSVLSLIDRLARRLRRRFSGCLAVVVGSALLASPSPAMTVIAPSFQDLVAKSTQVLRVQVTGVSDRWDPSAYGNVIHTYVQCTILKTLKGTPDTSITLRLLGGQVGDIHFEVPGMPSFEVGQSYVIFVAGNGDAFCPIVAAMHGSYPIVTDASTQVERVLRSNRQPLTSVDAVAVPMPESTGPTRTPTSTGIGMTRAEFEDSILKEVARGSAH